jgi:2-amino-4-hydroxy-6-hydroxymethyldihydropteridine diphosphokinase
MLMTTVYLALGANVGDAQANIDQAVALLSLKLQNIRRAPLYRTKAFGYTDQPDFLNTAIVAETNLSPPELLSLIKDTEKRLGRVHRFHWGPREIDIDIIFYGKEVFKAPDLEIPHPGLRQRDFVLRPLCDLDPDLIDPLTRRTVKNLLQELPPEGHNIIN